MVAATLSKLLNSFFPFSEEMSSVRLPDFKFAADKLEEAALEDCIFDRLSAFTFSVCLVFTEF